MARNVLRIVALCVALGVVRLGAEDWPEWRGHGRAGVWNESGILSAFPPNGLKARWRTPVHMGFSGPAVAGGRVFLTDYREEQHPRGTERALALDEGSGRILWAHEWPAFYGGIQWPVGPRATPTVDDDRVYVLGVNGKLFCLNVTSGAVLWQKDYVAQFGADPGTWTLNYGFTSAPIIDGDRVIAMVGGQPNGKVIAFDKRTGKEVWRALSSETDLGAAQLLTVTAGGIRQLIVWYPGAVASLNPETGAVYWDHPYRVGGGASAPTPVYRAPYLFLTNFYDGPLMLTLGDTAPGAKEVWKGKSTNELRTDGLHSAFSTPAIVGDFVYGIDSYGQFRCLRLSTGERIWETQIVTKERARWASAHMVLHGDRLFISNDRGELIIVKPSPDGYQEIDRTPLIKPTSPPGNRRQLVGVSWSHPAYANKHIFVRNDEEIVSYSLAGDRK